MINIVRPCIAIIVAFLLQVTILPAYLSDPFRPNLLLVIVVWLGLNATQPWGALSAYLLGLAQDSVSGLYLGLNGFSYLITFLVLHNIAHRLYADSRYLMTLAVFAFTVVCGVTQLLLLALFSSADGIYSTLLTSLLPQGVVNALVASLFLSCIEGVSPEEET